MSKIILITGGQRSGKSSFGQSMALQMCKRPLYIATSRVWDKEYQKRIERHKADRGDKWDTIEEEKVLSKLEFNNSVALIDCVTLWATNHFFDNKADIDKSLEDIKNEFDRFTGERDGCLIFITNETGMGGISADKIQRSFTDLQGWVNQYIASKAHEVYLMISGIAVKIK